MKPNEIFDLIRETEFNTSGLQVDWKVIVDKVDGVIRLLFEESSGKQDWKTNLNFPAKLYKRQKYFFHVHGGYGKAWKSCNDEVMKAFIDAKMRFPLYETQIAGWSYGGAMAVLAAEDYKYRTGLKVDELMTFGAPKPLYGFFSWLHFRKSVKESKQYTLTYDFVTWVPPLYSRINTVIVDKKNCWKLWRVFNIEKYHCSYGDETYYK